MQRSWGEKKPTVDIGKALGESFKSCISLCEALPSAGYSGTCGCTATASLTAPWGGQVSEWGF